MNHKHHICLVWCIFNATEFYWFYEQFHKWIEVWRVDQIFWNYSTREIQKTEWCLINQLLIRSEQHVSKLGQFKWLLKNVRTTWWCLLEYNWIFNLLLQTAKCCFYTKSIVVRPNLLNKFSRISSLSHPTTDTFNCVVSSKLKLWTSWKIWKSSWKTMKTPSYKVQHLHQSFTHSSKCFQIQNCDTKTVIIDRHLCILYH